MNKAVAPLLPLSYFEQQQLRDAMGPFRDAGIVFIHVPKTAWHERHAGDLPQDCVVPLHASAAAEKW